MKSIISEVQILPVKPNNGLVGFASLVVDNKIYLSSIAIYSKISGGGYRITYPTKQAGKRNLQIFHPINAELAEAIQNAVLKEAVKIFERSDEFGHGGHSYPRF